MHKPTYLKAEYLLDAEVILLEPFFKTAGVHTRGFEPVPAKILAHQPLTAAFDRVMASGVSGVP